MLLVQLTPQEHAALSAVALRQQTSLRALVVGALRDAGLLDEPKPSTDESLDESLRLTSAEAATILGVGTAWVAKLVRSGRLSAAKSGPRHDWQFNREDVVAYASTRPASLQRRPADPEHCA